MKSPPPYAIRMNSVNNIPPEAAREAFLEHVRRKAMDAHEAYGPQLTGPDMLRLLEDEQVVRYPTSVHFDDSALQQHEFAFAKALGFHTSDGFALCIHPVFKDTPDAWPFLMSYHIPVINYGDLVDAEVSEVFGATLLGIDQEEYYQAVCRLADSIPLA